MNTAQAGTITLGEGLTVNRIGFGAARIVAGRRALGALEHEAGVRALLRRVPELGIDFIDTADCYGPFISEELIGSTLAPYRSGLKVGTKVGLYRREGGVEFRVSGRREHIFEAVEGSLRRLRLDCIPLYQLHRIDRKTPIEETAGAFADLIQQGKIGYVGLSEVTVPQIEAFRALIPIASVQNLFNLVDRQHEAVLDYCEREGIAFIPWYPLATGLISEKEALVEIAAAHDATPNQIALAWLLRRSPCILTIPGTSSIKHLEENVGAADVRLSDDDFQRLSALWTGTPLHDSGGRRSDEPGFDA